MTSGFKPLETHTTERGCDCIFASRNLDLGKVRASKGGPLGEFLYLDRQSSRLLTHLLTYRRFLPLHSAFPPAYLYIYFACAHTLYPYLHILLSSSLLLCFIHLDPPDVLPLMTAPQSCSTATSTLYRQSRDSTPSTSALSHPHPPSQPHPHVDPQPHRFNHDRYQGGHPESTTLSVYPGSGSLEDPYVVDWSPNDPEDPYNWSTTRRWFITAQVMSEIK